MRSEFTLITSASLFFDSEQYRAVGIGIQRRRPLFRGVFAAVRMLSRSVFGNLLLVCAVILFYGALRSPPDGRLFQFGMSRNNIRVFRRLNIAASRADWNDAINGVPLSFLKRLSVMLSWRHLRNIAFVLTRHRSFSPFAHIQLVITGAAWCVFKQENFSRTRCVCVASDHSPVVMALLHVAREKKLRTCYAQHAPVADYFPPLNYDLSVLFDRASVSIYARAAAEDDAGRAGSIIVLPPFGEDATMPSLPCRPSYRIGLCLSYLWDPEGVEGLVLNLLDHRAVSSIHLRRHPRCRASLSKLLQNKRVMESTAADISEFSRQFDVALVPNSGVTIELLHFGIPVMYVSGTDFIKDDYYGFVRDKIVPAFDPAWLEDPQKLRSFFGEEWKKRFAFFDQTLIEPLEIARARAGKAFRDLVETPLADFRKG